MADGHSPALADCTASVNALTQPLLRALLADAAALRLGVATLANGTVVVDAGIEAAGGLEAGRRIAELCLGGCGRVSLRAGSGFGGWTWHLDVHSTHPVLACLASQYAGWSLKHGAGQAAFFALGSGPARALGSREPLFAELGYRDRHTHGCLVLEVDRVPPVAVAEEVAQACGIAPAALTLVLTPTYSLAGTVQVVARVLEVALHKAHEIGFPLAAIRDGAGTAPLAPPARDFLTAMGRTNDAIIFGGDVHLFVDCDDEQAHALARELPSSTSSDYGRPFAEIFKACDYDFYKVDKLLFSPARARVTSLGSGTTFVGGRLDEPMLDRAFGRE
ncbi:MAG: methenyltetrahydromethanopterin cyclohydrolase [Gammaproteobacteria bacterium]|nr:methenyltetrahydromethanopterin cyclohydrolase [Gammaproteobacteria bacterium]